jgi:uncharacterized protein with PQ loop repeat
VQHDTLVVVFGLLTTILAVGYGVPQWLKVRRTGSVAGVSVPSISCALVSAVAWVLYGVWLQDIWVVLTSGAAIPGLTAALVVLLRSHASRQGLWMTWAWVATILAAAAAVPVTEAPITLVLGGSILWYVAPAMWTAWTSADVSGISRGAWILLLVESAVCTAYGVLADVPAYLVYAGIASIGAISVLVRLALPAQECGACPPLRACGCRELETV